MIVTAWSNGGSGFGVKVSLEDRNRHFHREWQSVTVYLGDRQHSVSVNVGKKSFWTVKCGELISVEIRRWLQQHGFIPWPLDSPPRLRLEPVGHAQFLLTTL